VGLVHSGTKELNSIRARILFPDAGGFQATLPYRNLLARNDWLPLLILLNCACIAFGVVSALSPLLLANGEERFLRLGACDLCWQIFAFAMSATLIIRGISEWPMPRAGPLLFVSFRRNDAYLVDVLAHGAWNDQRLVEIVMTNWPEAGFFFKLRT
jgi:hypothetical protein